MTIFQPFEGVCYVLFFGADDDSECFYTKAVLLQKIARFEPVTGVMQVEWNDTLQKAQWHDVSEAIASEWVALNYLDLLDDNGEIHSQIDPFFYDAARRLHRDFPRRVSA